MENDIFPGTFLLNFFKKSKIIEKKTIIEFKYREISKTNSFESFFFCISKVLGCNPTGVIQKWLLSRHYHRDSIDKKYECLKKISLFPSKSQWLMK